MTPGHDPTMGTIGLRVEGLVEPQPVKPGTFKRIIPYAMRHRRSLAIVMLATIVDSVIMVSIPLMLKMIVDDGIVPGEASVVFGLAGLIAGLALLNVVAIYLQAWFSGRVGQGLIFDLRTKVFTHIQRQPVAFFTRTQTGSLVSRINTDIVGAEHALTTLLSQSLSTVLTLILVLGAMLYLSWPITVVALVMIPLFFIPGKVIARRMERLARSGMQNDAELGSMMTERFNISGAMLVKLYGRPEQESAEFAKKASLVRDIAISMDVHARLLFILVSLLTTITTALVYGFGGWFVIEGQLQIGTLVAMVALLLMLYSPINQLTNIQSDVMTALVSFDRVFEVLDLEPLITERPGARALPDRASVNGNGHATAPHVEFDSVAFRYPNAEEVSLPSLELLPLRKTEHGPSALVLNDVSFHAPAGRLTALVGPSGAGKTTITHLVPRLYDATSGTVRIGGHDVRQLTLDSLQSTVGVVTQDAHLFHDTIRANLMYARPDATEREVVEACDAARIWPTISQLPDGLDTVVGDRGYRLSGGEKQRLAIARLLLKSPPIVVLDEATAHLDSESELAIQRALKTALTGRTSLVIAHRLSTIQDADQILVIDEGRIQERGTHDQLLTSGGLYAELYRTQFAHQQGHGEPAESTAAGNGNRALD
ncbi:ABC transporter ATP-binding protein [Streptomyces sp. NBC_00576]|uniref:ABC transporter ATP-binding protein n=1 Tax=Streptomyces sp. NBC_00576 TaxID=2903665 RepID=UPI002E8208C4|nr:ABC transporter ATP-binding protein [Streptomyces sp. NBC_00576]WUB68681.1 ABC transporter ATP-binding protein/permease [Streptomyces sp. NBC_00576]WUB77016.1 ABC transporter ATP-binding protein/permease [Streptomyces sp. NBC_00576]